MDLLLLQGFIQALMYIIQHIKLNLCAMLAHTDQDNIADYWAVGQHCTGKQFSCATLAQADQDNI